MSELLGPSLKACVWTEVKWMLSDWVIKQRLKFMYRDGAASASPGLKKCASLHSKHRIHLPIPHTAVSIKGFLFRMYTKPKSMQRWQVWAGIYFFLWNLFFKYSLYFSIFQKLFKRCKLNKYKCLFNEDDFYFKSFLFYLPCLSVVLLFCINHQHSFTDWKNE